MRCDIHDRNHQCSTRQSSNSTIRVFRMVLFFSLEREPPAMQVGKKEFYLCPENKPPDDRAQTGSPTVYKLAQREVIQMDMVIIAQSACNRQ